MALSPLFSLAANSSGNQPENAITISTSSPVWFSWTCPQGGPYIFSTRGSATNFPNQISVYTSATSPPNTPADLTQVTYIREEEQNGIGGGFEYASHVAFNATSGTTYYIGVLARDSSVTGTLNLSMVWGVYYARLLASCTEGNPLIYGGGVCLATLTVGDVTAFDAQSAQGGTAESVSFSFGTFAQMAGYMTIRYVGGSLMVVANPSAATTDIIGFAPATGQLLCNGTDVTGAFGANLNLYVSEYDAATSLGCESVQFNNTAGVIESVFTFGTSGFYQQAQSAGGGHFWWTGNHNGVFAINYVPGFPPEPANLIPADGSGGAGDAIQNNPYSFNFPSVSGGPDGMIGYVPILQNSLQNPILQLLYTDPISYVTLNSIGNVTASGANWKMTPQFKNSDTAYGWDNVSIGLEINNVSTGLSDTVTFPENGTQSPSFTFSASPTSGLLTATFTLTRNSVLFNTIANVPLYPTNFSGLGLFLDGGGGSSNNNPANGPNTINFTSQITIPGCTSSTQGNGIHLADTSSNNSYFGGTLQYLITISGGGQLYNGSACTPQSSLTVNNSGVFYISQAAGPATLTVTPQFVISGTVIGNLPALTWAVTW